MKYLLFSTHELVVTHLSLRLNIASVILHWQYSVGERGELLLTHELKIKGTSTPIYFNVYDFKAYDFNGVIYPKIMTPSATVLKLYYQDVDSRALPPLSKEEGRPVCLKNHPQVEFSREGFWIDRASGRPVCGLKPPID